MTNKTLADLQPYIKHDDNVYSPLNDKFKYFYTVLKNKLKIFVVTDDESFTSSAVMYVGVGSSDNPKDIDGLAHYLEHMLFMGSDKYPGGTYFQNQVSKYGGTTNAFTTEVSTQYFFSATDNFIELLNIFSRFFVKPLFSVEYVEKEVKAVDSEHKKNIGTDGWRLMNVSKNFYNEENNRFSTGTEETLLGSVNNDPNILRQKLIEFYDRYYSSDEMILFISHKMIGNDMQKIESMFEQIPLRKTVPKIRKAQVKLTNDSFEMIKVKTVTEDHCLSIKWLLKGSSEFVNGVSVDSYDILSYILNSNEKGSLYDLLKSTNVVSSVYANIDRLFSNQCFYELMITLTEEGLVQWKNILYLTDAYINNLFTVSNSNSSLSDKFHNEKSNLALLYLQNVDKTDGLNMCQYFADLYERKKLDLSLLPIGFALLCDKINCRNHLNLSLSNMTLDKAKVILFSPLIDESELDRTDKFYGTKYSQKLIRIDSDKANEKRDLIKSLSNTYVPKLNPYITVSKIEIVDPIEKDDESYRRIRSKNNNVYYLKKGNTYQTYSVFAEISVNLLKSEESDPDMVVQLMLYCAYIDKLKEAEDQRLSNAKMNIHIVPDNCKLLIIMNGYNNEFGMDNIFSLVLNWFYSKNDINEKVYEIVFNDLMTDLQNYKYTEPYQMIGSEFKTMVNKKYISNSILIKALNKLNPKTMSVTSYKFFQNTTIKYMSYGDIQGVFGGSITVKQVTSIIDTIEQLIKPSNSGTYDLDLNLANNLIVKNMNPNNKERAIGYGVYFGNMKEVGEDWKTEKPLCNILESFMSERFSASVRTEKQIGYVAMCTFINVGEHNNPEMYLTFVVQSTRQDLLDIVKEYVENDMMTEIQNLSDQEFEDMKQSIIISLSEKPSNIRLDCDEIFTALINTYDNIENTDYEQRFQRKHDMIDKLQNTTLEIFIDFVTKHHSNNVRAIVQIIP